jgi:phosphatidylethanolamine-binding protein (PEBP) family uncharacterized protein
LSNKPGAERWRWTGNRDGVIERTVLHRLHALRNLQPVPVWSTGFLHNGSIPLRYTADGEGVSPPLNWRGDFEAASFGLLVEDADAPAAHPLVHARAVNLNSISRTLAEGALTSPHHDGSLIDPALHSSFTQAWLPPHPPLQDGEHHYAFQIFALRFEPRFAKAPCRSEFIEMVLEFATAGGCVIGTYRRPRPLYQI